jgi:hypothetical protein
MAQYMKAGSLWDIIFLAFGHQKSALVSKSGWRPLKR